MAGKRRERRLFEVVKVAAQIFHGCAVLIAAWLEDCA